MKDDDWNAFFCGRRLEGGIRTAVEAWFANRDAAKDQYGPIASWNTSEVIDMYSLFFNKTGFNENAHNQPASMKPTMALDPTNRVYGPTCK